MWLGFAGFCLVCASGWLMAPVLGPVRIGVYGVVGLTALVVNGRRCLKGAGFNLRLGVAGVGLLGVPGLIGEWAGGHVSGVTSTVVLALVPVVTMVVVAQVDGDRVRRLMGAALVGFGGVLLLVPLEVPVSVMGRMAVAALLVEVVVIAVSGVWAYELLREVEMAQALAMICIPNAIFLAGVGLVYEPFRMRVGEVGVETVVGGGLFLVQMVLLVWLLRSMRPVQFATRYLLIPLLTIVEGYVLMRPELSFRMGVGIGLLAVGTGWILLARQEGEEPSMSLLR